LFPLVGGVVGFAIGAAIYLWLWRNYSVLALVLPGALLGLGVERTANGHSRGLLCAIVALVGSVILDWKERPFVDDASLLFYTQHIWKQTPVVLLMAAGCGLAYWWGREGRGLRLRPSGSAARTPNQGSP
jgi:hypothetical protein